MESFDLAVYEETPLALEAGLADGSEFWFTAPLAGMQFYSHGAPDGLGGRVYPQPGDRLHLVRRPENPADCNAVEVWWKNEYMIGHLPRGVAADIAGSMDAGKAARAYVVRPGTGETWSLEVIVVGAVAEARHASRVRRWVKDQVREASAEVWPMRAEPLGRGVEARWGWYVPSFIVPGPRPPTAAQAAAEEAFRIERLRRDMQRQADCTYAFGHLPPERAQLPDGADALPDEAMRGKVFGWWNEVPVWLMTKTKLREHGLRPGKGTAPFATISYSVRRHWRLFELYAVADCLAVRFQPEAAAQAAERLRKHNPGAEAMRQRAAERSEAYEARRRRRWREERSDNNYGHGYY